MRFVIIYFVCAVIALWASWAYSVVEAPVSVEQSETRLEEGAGLDLADK